MRIAMLSSGLAVHTERWARAYRERDHEVHLLTIRPVEIEGVKTHCIADGHSDRRHKTRSLLSYARLALATRGILDSIRPDVVNPHYSITHGAIARWAGATPCVLSVWGSDIIWNGKATDSTTPEPLWFRAMNRYALARPSAVVSTSRFLLERTRTWIGPTVPLRHIAWGIDTEIFCPPPHRPYCNRRYTIGFTKSLEAKYAPEILLEAFSIVASLLPEARLILGGRGPMKPALVMRAKQLGLAERVDFPGFIPHAEVPRLMHQMDVFVNPSRHESFGVAILEASACGLPVVATRVGGVPETCRDNETGLLVDKEDPQALADSLVRLARDPERRRRLGAAGRRFVLGAYRWNNSVEQMIEILHRAAKGDPMSEVR